MKKTPLVIWGHRLTKRPSAPEAVYRADTNRLSQGNDLRTEDLAVLLQEESEHLRVGTISQYQARRLQYEKKVRKGYDDATLMAEILREFEQLWAILGSRLKLVPGKDLLRAVSERIQTQYKVSLTSASIVEGYTVADIPKEMTQLIEDIESFRMASP